MNAADNDNFDQPQPEPSNPPLQPTVTELEDDFADIGLSVTAMIRERQEQRNIPQLRLEAGQKAQLRLLRFGEQERTLSVISRHLVFDLGRLGCPRRTDAVLGGDRRSPCPLCELLEAGSLPDHLKPGRKTELWAYALVLAIDRGNGWEYADPETQIQPRRLRFEGEAKLSLVHALRADPDLADLELGTNLLVIAEQAHKWQLSRLDRAPLRLSAEPIVRERQLQRLGDRLGEPYLSAHDDGHLVATSEELEAAAAHLKGHQRAPARWSRRFWDELMNGSLPPWERPALEAEKTQHSIMSEKRQTATGNSAVGSESNMVRTALAAHNRPAPQPEPRNVMVPGKGSTITEAAKAIYSVEAEKLSMFLTAGAVSVIEQSEGHPLITLLSPSAAQSRFEKHVRLVQPAKEGVAPAILNDRMAAAILAAEPREILPRLNTIVEWPFLVVRDGQLVSLAPGFNPLEGIYVASNRAVETMTTEEAVRLLRDELFGEFLFLRPSDQSRAIAALLTPALMIGRLIPGFVAPTAFEANASQAGKGTCVRCIEGAYGEPGNYVNNRKGGVGSLDESIDGALIEGRPILVLDNLRGSLNSEALESIITKDRHKARTPYRAYVNVDTTRFCFFLTSNGVNFTADMSNRLSIVRLRRRINYVFKTYPEGTIDRHAAANVPRFLGAIHAVIKAWYDAGRHRTDDTRHTFLAWSQSLDWIVQNIFHCAPLMDDHASIRDRLSRPGLGFVRLLCVAVQKVGRLGEQLRAQDLFNITEENQVDIPGVNQMFVDDDRKGARLVGQVLSRAFGNEDQIDVEEYTVLRAQVEADEVCHHACRTYQFDRVAEGNPVPLNPPLLSEVQHEAVCLTE